MADRVVVITGATGKLGPTVAERFAANGDRLALLARDEESCIGVAMALPGGIRRHRGIPVDLSDPVSATAAADTVREKLGPAQVLLHLVGTYAGGAPFADSPLDEFRQLLETNLWSTIHAIRAFLPDIKAAEHGRIVTMSTPLAAAPVSNIAAYAATKAAVESLTLSVARDLAGTGATANVILVRTIGAEKPTHTRPEEIAAAMAWLCSPEASAVSGQRIPLVGRAGPAA
jgi:NAD(P)-dependent dehydrogenase (short-subunit alcohol dehydrogenase family)